MGQKTNPIGFRLGVNRPWNSRWYASDRDFADLVYEDMMIKRYINRRLENAGISGVMISRAPKKVTVDIKTARPGIVIGRRGAEVDKLREELQMLTGKDIALNIVEVRKPELDARLVADSIARQLEGRVSFRRAMKKAVAATMKMGADGIKVQCGGRLGGAEIARTEKYKDGRVPLHTLRADIDYSTATAATTYGCIGVKVWICRGEILGRGPLGGDEEKEEMITPDASPATRPRRGKAARGQKRRPRGRVRRPESKPNRGEGEARPRGRRPEGPASKPASERSRGGPKDTTQQRPPKPKGGPKGTTQ
ncbi:MAG: 30S ribosomal protein S3, partial [Candidatus Zixiibacteriota bacterium]